MNIEHDRVFQREEEVVWRCRNCGFLHIGKKNQETSPACIHPQAHFELLGENWKVLGLNKSQKGVTK